MGKPHGDRRATPASPFPGYAREIRGRPQSWFLKAEELLQCGLALADICDEAQGQFFEIVEAKKRQHPEGWEWSPEEGRLFALQRARRVPLMLIGLALENLAKGALIEADPPRAQNKKQWTVLTSGHKLKELVEEMGIALEDSEVETCRALEEAVLWSARYAVPKDETEGDMQWSEEHQAYVPPGSKSWISFKQAHDLWNRVCSELQVCRPPRSEQRGQLKGNENDDRSR